MSRLFKRVISILLTVSMLCSLGTVAFAEEGGLASEIPSSSVISGFNFEFSEYAVNEGNCLSIKVLRNDTVSGAVDVTVKIADLISEYGEDYYVCDSRGINFERAEGEKPDLSDMEVSEDDVSFPNPQIAEDSEEDDSKPKAEDEVPLSTEEVLEETTSESAPGERVSSGSKLMDAANGYLGIETPSYKNELESNSGKAIAALQEYFVNAQGAWGSIHFDENEEEKVIKVYTTDNAVNDGARVFMIALMGTSDESMHVAPNATTYVNIIDNDSEETARFSVVSDNITLSKQNPSSSVTVVRSGGLNNFETVYVSTVQKTLPEGAYTKFSNSAVSFSPYETEKKVEISATDFSEGGIFGVRLEGDGSVLIDNDYIEINALKNEEQAAPKKAMLLGASNGSELGYRYSTLDGFKTDTWPEYSFGLDSTLWSKEVTGGDGDNYAKFMCYDIPKGDSSGWPPYSYYYNCLEVHNENKGKHSMIYTKDKYDMRGIYALKAKIKTYQKGSSKKTYFELDSDQTYSGSIAQWSKSGNFGWTNVTLSAADVNSEAYIKFAVTPTGSGDFNQPRSQLTYLNFAWTRYAFDIKQSNQYFKRYIYDLAAKKYGDENFKLSAFYDGEDSLSYHPGDIELRDSSGRKISAFFGNCNSTSCTIESLKTQENLKKGIHLKGVYLANPSVDPDKIPVGEKGGDAVTNAMWVSAKSEKVNLTVDKSFMLSLISRGVVSNKNKENETIAIYPVYVQDTVSVNFENTDTNGDKAYNKGKLYSHINNVVESWVSGGNSETVRSGEKFFKSYLAGGKEYYGFDVPYDSIIRVSASTVSSRIPNGIAWWEWGGERQLSYYKKGDRVATALSKEGRLIEETDYSKADIVVRSNISVVPNTGKQSVHIGYFDTYVRNKQTGEVERQYDKNRPEDLSGRAVLLDTSKDIKSAENGLIYMDDVYTGQSMTFYVTPPEGCYTVWTNMTGDTQQIGEEGYGIISAEEKEADRRYRGVQSETNPWYLVGNRLTITLQKDNTRFYYQFIEKSKEPIMRKKYGHIYRDSNTFYRLVNNLPSQGRYGVEAAQVFVGDLSTYTDKNGMYEIDYERTANAGYTSSSAIIEGNVYNFVSPLEESDDSITIQALEAFKAESLKARYKKVENAASINDNSIVARDDELTIEAKIKPIGTLRPVGASFYLVRGGEILSQFTDAEASFSETTATATLKFNPKAVLRSNDKIYVSFTDENGRDYPAIDLGFIITAELSLGEFIFPLIGASMAPKIEADTVFDIIGNAMFDASIGGIGSFSSIETRTVQASGISEEERKSGKAEWTETDYAFGFNRRFDSSKRPVNPTKSDGTKKTDEEVKDEQVQEVAKDVAKADKVEGAEKPKNSGVSTKAKYTWNITPELGFKLTVSTRTGADGEAITCFEDISCYFKVTGGSEILAKIALPIGISVIVGIGFDAQIVGVYHMYNGYALDDTHMYDYITYKTTDCIFVRFSDRLRHEGYIFLDPTITVTLGISAGILKVLGHAKFIFNMDFKFPHDGDIKTFGEMDIDLDWGIHLAGFKVYSKKYNVFHKKLFGDTPIDFNYGSESLNKSVLKAFNGAFSTDDGQFSLTTPDDRTYLERNSEWRGDRMPLMAAGSAFPATTERILQSGVAGNPDLKLLPFGDNSMLMVYIGDDVRRNDVNKRTVFYSISNDGGNTWSQPGILDDDGTADDYPDVSDLGNGKMLVSWSSAEKEFEEGASVVDMLKAMNIKVCFFDTETEKFDTPVSLTKTTDEDYCADTLPHGVYDSETDRIILYYTKTEYDNIEVLDDFGNAKSVTAYLFYENGKWNNDASAYEESELLETNDPNYYREQWYGQRFLNLRRTTDKSEAIPVIVSTDAIGYNGLSLYTWVADNDGNVNTTDDRDVYLQIYNFSENSFSHIIKVTENSGTYLLPQFGRSDNSTYLFYGCRDERDMKNAENTEDYSGVGEICYLDISYLIKNGLYVLNEAGNNMFYELKSLRDVNECEPGSSGVLPSGEDMQYVWANKMHAVTCNNISDYKLYVASDGKMYLFWADSFEGSHHIFVSMLDETDAEESSGDLSEDEKKEYMWSDPLRITEGEDIYYSGIGAAVIGDRIYIGCVKGNYKDEADTAHVLITHNPGTDVTLELVYADSEYPLPGENVKLNAVLKNNGLISSDGKHKVEFYVNGVYAGESVYEDSIAGAAEVKTETSVIIPDEFDSLVYKAVFDGQECEIEYECKADYGVYDEIITAPEITEGSKELRRFEAVIANEGNKDGNLRLEAFTSDRPIGECDAGKFAVGDSKNVSLDLEMSDGDYTVSDETNIATAEVTVRGYDNDELVFTVNVNAYKEFDSDAANKINGATVEKKSLLSMKVGETKRIAPKINSADDMKIFWKNSSDEDVVRVNNDGSVSAEKYGSATISGILVPNKTIGEFDEYGRYVPVAWESVLPSSAIKTVSAVVKVTDGTKSNPSGPSSGETKENDVSDDNTDVVITNPDEGENTPKTPESLPFTDVFEGDWFMPSVRYVYENKLMNGVMPTLFDPSGAVSRAMLVTVIYRMENEPRAIYAKDFSDIRNDDYFANAVRWASANGIVNGISEDEFAPNEAVTREQLAAILCRYAYYKGVDTEEIIKDIESIDANDISEWALGSVKYCIAKEIIRGDENGRINPLSGLTRAELATVLERLESK